MDDLRTIKIEEGPGMDLVSEFVTTKEVMLKQAQELTEAYEKAMTVLQMAANGKISSIWVQLLQYHNLSLDKPEQYLLDTNYWREHGLVFLRVGGDEEDEDDDDDEVSDEEVDVIDLPMKRTLQ